MLPDTSDADKMALIGRLTVLRKARRDAAYKLRDKVMLLLNSMESRGEVDPGGITELVDEIRVLNAAIAEQG